MIDPRVFHAAFGAGGEDAGVSPVDQLGVALVAIKGLYELVQRNERELVELRALVEAAEGAAR